MWRWSRPPATEDRSGHFSRIVPALPAGHAATALPTAPGTFATEYGVAEVCGLDFADGPAA